MSTAISRASFAALLAAFAMSVPAHAEETGTPPHTVSANVGLVSDYYFRGLTQTWGKPAIQGGFDFAHASGLYAGTWASNVSGNQFPGGSMEWDFYAGYNHEFNDAFTLGAGAIYYFYPGANYDEAAAPAFDEKFDTAEVYLSATWKFLTFKWSYALTDYFGVNEDAGYLEDSDGTMYFDLTANYALPVWEGLALVAHVGYTRFPDDLYAEPGVNGETDASYVDWKLGITKTWSGGWNAGLFYVGAGNDVWENTASFANSSTRDLNKSKLIVQVGRTF